MPFLKEKKRGRPYLFFFFHLHIAIARGEAPRRVCTSLPRDAAAATHNKPGGKRKEGAENPAQVAGEVLAPFFFFFLLYPFLLLNLTLPWLSRFLSSFYNGSNATYGCVVLNSQKEVGFRVFYFYFYLFFFFRWRGERERRLYVCMCVRDNYFFLFFITMVNMTARKGNWIRKHAPVVRYLGLVFGMFGAR